MKNSKRSSVRNGFKLTTVGDDIVDRTSLLLSYYGDVEFPRDCLSTLADNQSHSLTVNETQYNLTLWNTIGQEYPGLRRLSYPRTDCFLLCYAIDCRETFESILTKWYPEVRHFGPRSVPIILVATNTNVDRSSNADLVTTIEGLKLMRKIRAYALVECSTPTMNNLEEVFCKAINAIYDSDRNTCRKCVKCTIM